MGVQSSRARAGRWSLAAVLLASLGWLSLRTAEPAAEPTRFTPRVFEREGANVRRGAAAANDATAASQPSGRVPAPARRTPSEPEPEDEAILPTAGSISGVVVDARGAPIRDFALAIETFV